MPFYPPQYDLLTVRNFRLIFTMHLPILIIKQRKGLAKIEQIQIDDRLNISSDQ